MAAVGANGGGAARAQGEADGGGAAAVGRVDGGGGRRHGRTCLWWCGHGQAHVVELGSGGHRPRCA
jgi:hypothetical protein